MHWADQLAEMTQATRVAGQAVERIARDGFETYRKGNDDPVTAADLEANRILKGALLDRFPSYGWLSEETTDSPERLGRKLVFIVDPIDGTKEFSQGIPEYALSVALVEDGLPVVGVVYNPATDELFAAVRGMGATLNGERILARRTQDSLPAVLASRSEIARGEWAPFAAYAAIRPSGSIAYKLALIAAGRADSTFSLGPKNEWDIAAGVLLVDEAGGKAVDLAGQGFVFNRSDPLVSGIVAASTPSYGQVRTMIGQYYEQQRRSASFAS